jgi:hypothetical protein
MDRPELRRTRFRAFSPILRLLPALPPKIIRIVVFKLTENVRCGDGIQALAGKLAEGICAQAGSVELADPIKKIELRENRVIVNPSRARPVHADYVVLAVPPSA